MASQSIQLDAKSANPFSSGLPELVLENGTNIPVSGYAFDAATSEQIFLQLVAVGYLSGNVTLRLQWYSRSASTTGAVVWGGQFAAITPGDAQSVLTDALATASTTTTTVNGTARGLTQTDVVITSLDSIAAGDNVQLRIYRDAAAGGDTMVGDAILESVEIIYAATGGIGAGDFNGPAGSTSGNIVSFSGTTGKVGQDSGVSATAHAARHIPGGSDSAFPGTYSAGDVPYWDGSAFVPRQHQCKRLSADVTTSGTGDNVVSGLAFTIPRAGTYAFRYDLTYQCSSTTGNAQAKVDFTGTVTSIRATALRTAEATNASTTGQRAGTTTTDNGGVPATGAVAAATTDYPWSIVGTLVAASSGTLNLNFAMSANTLTVQDGSMAELIEVL